MIKTKFLYLSAFLGEFCEEAITTTPASTTAGTTTTTAAPTTTTNGVCDYCSKFLFVMLHSDP